MCHLLSLTVCTQTHTHYIYTHTHIIRRERGTERERWWGSYYLKCIEVVLACLSRRFRQTLQLNFSLQWLCLPQQPQHRETSFGSGREGITSVDGFLQRKTTGLKEDYRHKIPGFTVTDRQLLSSCQRSCSEHLTTR